MRDRASEKGTEEKTGRKKIEQISSSASAASAVTGEGGGGGLNTKNNPTHDFRPLTEEGAKER